MSWMRTICGAVAGGMLLGGVAVAQTNVPPPQAGVVPPRSVDPGMVTPPPVDTKPTMPVIKPPVDTKPTMPVIKPPVAAK